VTSAAAAPTPSAAARPEPPFDSSLVEELLRAIGRAVRAHQLYLQNNPVYLRSIEAARGAFAPVWSETDEISLQVSETQFTWEGVAVLADAEKAADSLPWLFFKDGVRELRFLRGFETEELGAFLDLIRRARVASPDEDDLLTMLWEQDFLYLRYGYVDLTVDGVAPVESTVSADRPTTIEPPTADDEDEAPRPGIVNIEDFDATLYFLDETEVEYLRNGVAAEYGADLRRNVLSILFDIFEQRREPKVREELCAILDNLMVTLLSAGHLRAVAFLLREATVVAERAPELTATMKSRFSSLADRLSHPSALAQLLQTLEEAGDPPPQEDLAELFEQLRPGALGTVLAWIGKTQDSRVRGLLEAAGTRLAASNTTELVRLIGSRDRAVAIEAVRRAGALRTSAAIAPLGKVLAEGDPALRLAAVTSLGEIGSAGAMQPLERAIDDPDRDVRIATARVLATRLYRAALPRVEGAIKGRALREADLTEKMAFFEAYGSLCGDAGVALLDGLLNGRGFLGKREEAGLRACAAMALGRIASPVSTAALHRVPADEKDVIVRNAVNKALRGSAA
jgi:hypothetical protein